MALRRVFTYLGAVFLMSHIIFINNVSAIELSQDVNIVNSYSHPLWKDNNSSTWHDGTYLYSSNGDYSSLGNITLRPTSTTNTNVTSGQYVSFLAVASFSSHSGGRYNDSGNVSVSSTSTDCDLISLETDVNNGTNNNTSTVQEQVTYRVIINGVCRMKSNANNPTINLYAGVYTGSGVRTFRFNVYNYVVWSADTSLSTINQNINALRTVLNNIYSNNQDILNVLNDIRDNQHDVNQEQTDATNNSVQESQTQGDSSQSDAQTGTASLVSTIGSAVSAITSASPTNCLLNGNMGNFDMGQIDLCANPVPAFVQIISSLILILITVPLCIVLFNRFIGLFRSFQG